MQVRRLLSPDCFTLTDESASRIYEWMQQPPETRGERPQSAFRTRRTCNNHHWNLLDMCSPSKIKVVFRTVVLQRYFRRF